jgi:hypothetical protein
MIDGGVRLYKDIPTGLCWFAEQGNYPTLHAWWWEEVKYVLGVMMAIRATSCWIRNEREGRSPVFWFVVTVVQDAFAVCCGYGVSRSE